MPNRIKEITFYTENCEAITVPGKYIGEFSASEITRQITRVAMNAIQDVTMCEQFAIEIHKDANQEYLSFGIPELKTTVFDRLTEFDDITTIEFELVDDAVYYGKKDSDNTNTVKYQYQVNWDSEDMNDTVNRNQHSLISKNGWLYIVISADSTVKNIFDQEEINSPEYPELVTHLYDIGDEGWNIGRALYEHSYHEADAIYESCVAAANKGTDQSE